MALTANLVIIHSFEAPRDGIVDQRSDGDQLRTYRGPDEFNVSAGDPAASLVIGTVTDTVH